jgi:hypothetical protein
MQRSFIHSFIRQWLYSPLLVPGRFSSFVIFFTQTAGLLGQVINPPQGSYLHTGQHKHRTNVHTNIYASIAIRIHDPSRRAETVHALDRTATVISKYISYIHSFIHSSIVLQLFIRPWPRLQLSNHFYTDARTPWTSDQPVAKPLPTHRTTRTQKKRNIQTSMPRVEFEPTIAVFERTYFPHHVQCSQ